MGVGEEEEDAKEEENLNGEEKGDGEEEKMNDVEDKEDKKDNKMERRREIQRKRGMERKKRMEMERKRRVEMERKSFDGGAETLGVMNFSRRGVEDSYRCKDSRLSPASARHGGPSVHATPSHLPPSPHRRPPP